MEETKDWQLGPGRVVPTGPRDWLAAAAGDEELAEELRTGRCRCGVMLADEARGCRWHDGDRERIAETMRKAVVWDGGQARSGAGPRAEDLELLGRYLPADLLFCYEVLIHRSVVVPGSARGGRGYDESVVVGAGRREGGLGSTRSGETQTRGGANGSSRRGGSGKPVIRSEAAMAYRARVDRKLRRTARDILAWLESADRESSVFRCTGGRCGRFAEPGWHFCPTCGASVDEVRKDRSRS